MLPLLKKRKQSPGAGPPGPEANGRPPAGPDEAAILLSSDPNAVYEKLSKAVLQKLLREEAADDEKVKEIIALTAAELSLDEGLDLQKRLQLRESVFNRFRRLDLLQPLMDREDITEIMVNGPDKIFYEKDGQIFRSPQRFRNTEHLKQVICGFFARYNQNLSQSRPLASLRLPDGSRAHAVLAPAAPDGPILTIRKFSGIRPALDSLIRTGFVTEKAAEFLIRAVRERRAIIIGGGTGTGKTTLLNILSAYIPQEERIITIEDAPELQLQNRLNWVRLTVRPPQSDGRGGIDSAELIRNALRMRPDRIIVGEVRGDEAYDMMQAAMTGHPGTLCTIHANDCESMFFRLADLILGASRLRYEVILRHLASGFDYLVHLARDREGRRFISEIASVEPHPTAGYQLTYLCRREEKAGTDNETGAATEGDFPYEE